MANVYETSSRMKLITSADQLVSRLLHKPVFRRRVGSTYYEIHRRGKRNSVYISAFNEAFSGNPRDIIHVRQVWDRGVQRRFRVRDEYGFSFVREAERLR